MVHHIDNLNEDNISNRNITASFDNLRFDCKFCHDREEGHFIKQKKTLCSFDENGQPLPPHRKEQMKEGKTEAPTYFFTDDVRMKGGL